MTSRYHWRVSLNGKSDGEKRPACDKISAMAKKELPGNATKLALMARARAIGTSGDCMGWEDVRRKFDGHDALILKLWATAGDRDEIDRLCDRARWERTAQLKG